MQSMRAPRCRLPKMPLPPHPQSTQAKNVPQAAINQLPLANPRAGLRAVQLRQGGRGGLNPNRSERQRLRWGVPLMPRLLLTQMPVRVNRLRTQ